MKYRSVPSGGKNESLDRRKIQIPLRANPMAPALACNARPASIVTLMRNKHVNGYGKGRRLPSNNINCSGETVFKRKNIPVQT
jgi:hypothetical protein